MKTDITKKQTVKPVINKEEKIIPELPPKKKQSTKRERERIMEEEEPLPEIEKTHKHIHKLQVPVAGTKNNRTAG
ncbi:MAG: hypothetical protein JWN78_906 [Bacteroidota bacterium]|nr:hypothetical protein [Bacteroidota bacterium]